jgi:hypothetical protein
MSYNVVGSPNHFQVQIAATGAAEDAPGAGRGPEEAPGTAGVLGESTSLDEAQRLMSERSGAVGMKQAKFAPMRSIAPCCATPTSHPPAPRHPP